MNTITINEAAVECGVSRRTVERWLADGHLTRYLDTNGYYVRLNIVEVLRFNRLRRAHGSGEPCGA